MNLLPGWLRELIIFLGSEDVASYFENLSKVLTFSLELAGVLIAITGYRYIRDIRQKQKDAIFSFLSQFRIMLEDIRNSFTSNKELIINALSHDEMIESDDRQSLDRLIERCSTTLVFLRSTDNQYPAGMGWSTCMAKFVALLSDFENVSNPKYYLWPDKTAEEVKERYVKEHLDNIKTMITMIDMLQREMENNIFNGRVGVL